MVEGNESEESESETDSEEEDVEENERTSSKRPKDESADAPITYYTIEYKQDSQVGEYNQIV